MGFANAAYKKSYIVRWRDDKVKKNYDKMTDGYFPLKKGLWDYVKIF